MECKRGAGFAGSGCGVYHHTFESKRQEIMRPNSKLIKSTLTGALGGLIFGFDVVLISGIIDSVVRLYGLSDYDKGLTVAVGPVGTVLGCFIAGVLGQRMGARTALRWAAALYILCALGTALSLDWPMLLATRLLGGIGLGAATVLGPVYITELSPALWRGRLDRKSTRLNSSHW
jgi:MFS family permease